MARHRADASRCPLNVEIPPLPRESFVRPQLPPFNHKRRISHRYPLDGRTNPNFFSPLEASDDGWSGAIWNSQFPASCEEASFLLYEDDLKGQGLGYSIFFHVMALLLAMSDRRVLIEVPVDAAFPPADIFPSFGGSNFTNRSYALTGGHKPATRPRWCTSAPHTLGCFYEPLSHCEPPASTAAAPHVSPTLRPMGGTGFAFTGRWPSRRKARVVRVKLSTIYASWWVWRGKNSTAWIEGLRFLTRPRPWVREIGECYLRRGGLARHSFVSVFVRDSAEKRQELLSHRHAFPPMPAYVTLGLAAASALPRAPHPPRLGAGRGEGSGAARGEGSGAADDEGQRPPALFLQTSSTSSLRDFAGLVHGRMNLSHGSRRTARRPGPGGVEPRAGLEAAPRVAADGASSAASTFRSPAVVWTENPRSDHDEWGGWVEGDARHGGKGGGAGQLPQDGTTLQGTVAAVNAYVGSQAAVLISLRRAFSSWTDHLIRQMHPPDKRVPGATYYLCCRCTAHDGQKKAGNLALVVAPQLPQAARRRVRAALEEALRADGDAAVGARLECKGGLHRAPESWSEF